MGAMHRMGAGLVMALAAAGCGTYGENVPLEAARHAEPPPVVQPRVRLEPEPARFGEEPVEIAGARWQATATEYELPARLLRPVAALGAAQFYALAWDEAPFDRLLVPSPATPGRWREFALVY